jgi:hypothetical protein
MLPYRGFIVLGGGIVVVLGLFFLFMALGWPGGGPDQCTQHTPNTCYCEAYNYAQVAQHTPGVRQKVNTWFNLYSIATALLVAIFICIDRDRFGEGGSTNLIRSNSFEPDLYIFAVLFLGLGSMWFHAALRTPWSWFDGLSMYVFAAFLSAYTLMRIVGPSSSGGMTGELIDDLAQEARRIATALIWTGYGVVVVLFSVFGALDIFGDLTSLFLILILVGAYLAVEVIATIRAGWPGLGPFFWWLGGVGFIGVATLAWVESQTGKAWCNPDYFFQPHGLIWHPFAGFMAVCLYFYWRSLPDPAA